MRCFLQAQINRLCVGNYRYGYPHKRKKFMGRLGKELKVYRQTGNVEQLFNIANYAFLESFMPQNKKLHFDGSIDSVTRTEFGGAIA